MKTIYTAIIKRLQTELTQVKWIDLNTGQLEVPFTDKRRPPVAFPCILVDITIDRATALTDTLQECQATITLTIADDRPARTSANTKPAPSLDEYDMIAQIYSALQGYTGKSEDFSPLNRTRQERLRSSAGLFLYRLNFNTSFLDISNQSS
jgi:hypothetical protein